MPKALFGDPLQREFDVQHCVRKFLKWCGLGGDSKNLVDRLLESAVTGATLLQI